VVMERRVDHRCAYSSPPGIRGRGRNIDDETSWIDAAPADVLVEGQVHETDSRPTPPRFISSRSLPRNRFTVG
jgi:hypothetical protein